MNTKLLYITIISLLFILQACKLKETDCGDLSDVITNYNIADSNKAKIPYTGTDTLVFISDANDTATLIGQGKNTYYKTVRNSIGGGDCPRTSVNNYENIDIVFINNSQKLTYNIFLSSNVINPKTTSIKVLQNNIESDYSSIETIKSIKPTQDSIKINNTIISGVFMENKIILYNLNYGILKYRDNSNRLWTLYAKK